MNANPRVRRESARSIAEQSAKLLLLPASAMSAGQAQPIERRILLVRADVDSEALSRELTKMLDAHRVDADHRPIGVVVLAPGEDIEAVDAARLASYGLRPAGVFVCTDCGAEIPAAPTCAACSGVES